jgi:hypothetical protein
MCILEGAPGSEPKVRTELVPQPQAKTVEQRIMRLVAIAERIVNLVRAERPDHVIIEAAAKGQVWQAAALGEVHGVIKVQVFLESGQLPMVVEATEMRKVVVGKIERVFVTYTDKKGKPKRRVSYGEVPGAHGKKKRATVKDLIEGRLKERGLTFPSQDEMDAYVAARYCWGKVAAHSIGGTDDSKKT